MEPGSVPEFFILFKEASEIDPLSVTQQPCTIMVLITLDGGHAQGNVEGATLATELSAGRNGHRYPGLT
jgi:hypothetical protein